MRRLALALSVVLAAWLVASAQVSPPFRIRLLDEGVDQGAVGRVDCVGSTVACTRSANTGTITVSGVSTHNLLSSTHGDTTTGTVVRGDMIVGDSSPTWARLAKGSSGQFLRMADGNDPGWGESMSVIVASCGSAAGFAPADSTTYYMGSYAIFDCSTVYGTQSLLTPHAITITAVYTRVIISPTNGSAPGTVTYSVRQNDTTDLSVGTQAWTSSGDASFTGLSLSLSAGDTFAFKMATPAWSPTNPQFVYVRTILWFRQR